MEKSRLEFLSWTVLAVGCLMCRPAQELAAQTNPPTVEWQASFGGTNGDYLFSLRQTSDGGYILGGYSHSAPSGNKTSGTYGSNDYWIVKLNDTGAKQWETNYGGSGDDLLYCLQQTTDGGYVIGGLSSSGADGNKTSGNFGSNDCWVLKLDANGTKQWETNYGGSGADSLISLQQTSDGGYILGAYSVSGASGNKTSGNFGRTDCWVIKLDPSGGKLWETNFGGISEDYLYTIQQSRYGGYLLGGHSYSGVSGNKGTPNAGSSDWWVIKIDANGGKLWERSYGGSSSETLWAFQETSDGGYVLGGYSRSGVSGNKETSNFGRNDYWVIKLDAFRRTQWEADFGSVEDDNAHCLYPTGDGGVIVGGNSAGASSGNRSSPGWGGVDYWVLKLNASGGKQWETSFGGGGPSYLYGCEPTQDGGFVLGGYSSCDASGNRTSPSYGDFDCWLVKLAGPLQFVPSSLQRLGSGAFQFQISGGVSGQVLRLETSTDLISWDELFNVTNTGTPTTLVDTNALGRLRRYYRVH